MKVNELGSKLQESCMYGSIGIQMSHSEDTKNALFLQNSSLNKKAWIKKGLVENELGKKKKKEN